MLTRPNSRFTFLSMALACAALIVIALYMQHSMGLEPCPLCMSQRLAFIGCGVLAFIAFIHNPLQGARKIYSVLTFLFAVLGAFFASRQLWLQSLPEDQIPACGPGLAYMLESYPLMEVLSTMMQGNGNCAEVVWTLFGISIPGWSLLAFLTLIILSIWQFFRQTEAT